MPRFVLLYHECPPGYVKPSHYDFMLEFDGLLWTWELRELPAAWGGDATPNEVLPVTRLVDHRIAYLDYEGPISGDRGSVSRVMSGEFTLLACTQEQLRVRLESTAYHGEVQLTATSQRGHWLLEVSH
jgi:hypothetical protein